MSDSIAKMFWNLNQHLAILKAKALIFEIRKKLLGIKKWVLSNEPLKRVKDLKIIPNILQKENINLPETQESQKGLSLK